MAYSEPVGEENISGSSYSVSFNSTGDPTVRIIVQMSEGDGGDFFGAGSDALMQDVIDRLSQSSLLEFQGASRNWRVRREITPTPPEPVG